MWKLFNTSADKAGFRLQYMEIYNWGTFDNQIFKIEPKGNNSLLTGANGSGKTTFIDALLTLLVPLKSDRFYNQSSGVQKKGDRSEESYVLGHYGDIQKEGDLSTTSQKLRDKTTYSVLLASFSNTDEKIITLFQVRSFSNGMMKRTFGIAYKTLNITSEFSDFDAKGSWKKRLDKRHNTSQKKWIEYYDSPKKYAERLYKQFGMLSIKALSLFNKTVGIKALGDLDEFIKTNMLEKRDTENEYNQLKSSFTTLINTKNDIDKATEQIKQLEPINSIANQLKNINIQLEKTQENKEKSVFWFAQKGLKLANTESDIINIKIEEIDTKILELKDNEKELKDKETQLSVQIETDEVGRQIKDLEKEVRGIEKARDSRKGESDKYNKLAQVLNYPINCDEKTFKNSKTLAQEKKAKIKTEIDTLNKSLRDAERKEEDIKIELEKAIKTIKYLQNNNNNITGDSARIREQILVDVGASKDEIPFIGELIKVDDLEWEGSIEKVLHNFALRLIVPEKYYQEVNKYVNNTNLKGKIIYERYNDFTSLKNLQNYSKNKNLLINKISFKSNSKYIDWIEERISNQFNYTCADNLLEFNSLEKAITKKGLIKRKGSHEKDDRKYSSNRNNFVLGWDNKDKINYWKTIFKDLQDNEKEQIKLIREIDKKIKSIAILEENLSDLFKLFTKFDKIDWKTYANKVQEKKELKKRLENTNDKVKALQEQLKNTQNNLAKTEKEIDTQKDAKRNENTKLNEAKAQITSHSTLLNKVSENKPDVIDLINLEENNVILKEINYTNFSVTQKTFQKNISDQNEKLNKDKNNLNIKVSSKINAFKNPSEEILKKYKSWHADVNQLSISLEFISEYQKKYNNLIKEDLPSFESKFNKHLQTTIEDKVGNFKFFFNQWSEDIKENISSLNNSLKAIDFNNHPTTTYIQLKAQNKKTADITEFKALLENAIPNFKEFDKSIDARKNHFNNNIKPFIKQLENEKWREKTMDVRSWFEYNAEEINRETNHRIKTYTGMGQLSGGEKAQLTYTILASAIAYQFGLTKEGNSFRFIAIDEAFKAQDEEKAKYLINLCKQLHLQLLVVTPSDNIHIVENDISFVHYIERRDNKISWLYDMPIEKFQEEKLKYIAK
ncbi:hypothetical protein LNI88_05715 [Tenacibaculum dicentrarchi]|uniref:ATP-binding protein n=1 Tax=Tenacibaculum finnmarkense TaxID=2781243 RepID=UPI001E54AFFA|nr:SbcC/MukB-like Walker B domain-containing protein [Tenacibaculum finnmarkense]MCD8402921.1 hypothetical protein [Tenacibaculum finnmarkense genomovar finnmarkense]MCD8425182.1 hypothetical protein [Tenacibaculum dicentrarchi]MCD8442092.1 hypothetical protein [Tenacibaculum dicentrarchi]